MRLSAAALCVSLLLVGCDNQRVHEIYTGSPEQAVFVEANDTVLVTHVDAVEQDMAFIGQKNRYRLSPGKHTLVVEYGALFQIDADKHEKLKSPPIKVTFEAEPGKTYRFRHVEIKTVEEAKAFAKAPKLELISLPDNAVVNASFEQSLPTRFLPQLKFEGTETYGFASDQPTSAAGAATPVVKSPVSAQPTSGPSDAASPAGSAWRLESLKNLWQQATPQERSAFQEWLKNQ